MRQARRPDATRPPGPAWRPSALPLAVAAGVLTGAWAWWAWADGPTPGPAPAAAAAPAVHLALALPAAATAPAEAPSVAVPPAALTAAPTIPRQRDPNGDLTPDLADYVNPGEQPTMTEVIDRLHRAGVRTGLGAFSPPGTRPPLIGLAVPEDFDLPPGYVRHHQATDDGQRIEAVLMFAPDLQLRDGAGRPVAMPADRVVPPELAPPGLPLRRIVIPAPLDTARAGG